MGEDHLLEVFDRGVRDLETRHRLQLFDGDRLSCAGLLESELSALERTRDSVEQLDHVPRIDVRLIDRLREQRSGQCPFLRVRPLGEEGELRSSFWIESHIQPGGRHARTLVRKHTERVRSDAIAS